MKRKSILKTIRLTVIDHDKIDQYIKEHPYIRQFSTLVRIALSDYLQRQTNKTLVEKRPSFLWDYDLSRGELFEILNGPQRKRLWLVAKILEHGSWSEIWEFLNVNIIQADMSLLRLTPKTRRFWERALRLWKKAA